MSMSRTRTHTDTPVTRHELLAAFTCNALVATQRGIGTVSLLPEPVDRELLTILTADVLAYPVSEVRILAQCGRFVRVEYRPVAHADPDIVLACCPGAQPFHAAMTAFQRVRLVRPADWHLWYVEAKSAARALIPPLLALDPHPAEADFVVRWALLVCAQGGAM